MRSEHWLSGKQLTIVIVAVCGAVVLAPVGVMASSHSSISIVDAKHPSRTAAVTKSGAQVISGSVKVAGTSTIKGTVTAVPAFPGTPYSTMLDTGGVTQFVVPAGKRFRVTTVTCSIDVDAGVSVNVNVLNNDLGGPVLQVPLVKSGNYGTADVYTNTFATDVVLNPGIHYDGNAQTSDQSDTNGYVELYGYLVPA
jgi:hypothetical protein